MTALNGLQMMRVVNAVDLETLKLVHPANRLGPPLRQTQGELRDLSSGREQTALRSE
jgi:hypothetical protein